MNVQAQDMTTKSAQPQFYRFQVFQGKRNAEGKIERTNTVGMAYLKEGQGWMAKSLPVRSVVSPFRTHR